MRKTYRLLACLLLCALLLPGSLAWATGDSADPGSDAGSSLASPTDPNSILDGTVLTSKIQKVLDEQSIDPKQISVGYYYSATGDSWYFNGDKWFYPASMYKVPLVMLLAEKVHSGELTQDSQVYDGVVADIEEHILTYSNNDWAHAIRKYLGGDAKWREDAKQYAQLKDEDYSPDYLDYCYFNNRYMTSVMETLYSDSDSYPNVIDCLLRAEPTHYFRLSQSIDGVYDVAQKYGSFDDQIGQSFNHTTGIIYTPNPCIVTVMTCNVSNYEKVISDAALMLTEYSLSLDDQLKSYEEEKQAEEEAARKAEEDAADEKAEQERLAAERAAAEKAEQERLSAEQARKETVKKVLTIVGIAAVVVLAAFIGIRAALKKRQQPQQRRTPKSVPRSQQAQERHATRGGGGYKPKH